MNLNQIVFLILRRMRAPLLLVIFSYTVSLIGFVMIPGVGHTGKTVNLSFFDAFYILSYTATTIGFGEIPYAFTQEQRLWMTFTIYLSVVAWFYAIGAIISLFQEQSLKQAIRTTKFQYAVRNLHEPFYLICGYGETGRELVQALDKNELRVVVLEIQQERVQALEMTDHQFHIPHLCADAKLSEVLLYAGLQNPMCQGVRAQPLAILLDLGGRLGLDGEGEVVGRVLGGAGHFLRERDVHLHGSTSGTECGRERTASPAACPCCSECSRACG